MINDWYRLNMEIVLTANQFNGIEAGVFHDGLARQIEQKRLSAATTEKKSNVRGLLKRIFS